MFYQEPGSDKIAQAVEAGAAISTVNLAQVVSKLKELGVPDAYIHNAINVLGLTIVDFTIQFAYTVGLLRPLTKHLGLSLADRACLALAQHLNLPALTTDRVWENVSLDIAVQVIR